MVIESTSYTTRQGCLIRLAKDNSGNTLMLMAAGLLPLMAMIGGGVDMSRAYLAESRLQQACDAGVLAARKELGTLPAAGGAIPNTVATIGNDFFDLNYREGQYGTENTDFKMTLEGDYSISGAASVDVPTTLMTVFGYDNVPVSVNCGSQLNFPNIDLMMVLDVTGSMRHTNTGDAKTRIDSLRDVVKSFHAEIEANKSDASRMRYGFVPYASNVNVGHLLEDSWVVDNWTYQSRVDFGITEDIRPGTSFRNYQDVSGTYTAWVPVSSYAATSAFSSFSSTTTTSGAGSTFPTSGFDGFGLSCDEALPPSTVTTDFVLISSTSEPFAGPPAGTAITEFREQTKNGTEYRVTLNGSVCEVESITYDQYVQSYESYTRPYDFSKQEWTYKPVAKDVSNWRSETAGCMEERKSTQITDFASVDLAQNLDLDIDTVPTAGDTDTQWRPRYPNEIYARSWTSSFGGSWSVAEVTTTDSYYQPNTDLLVACPAPAQKLTEMTPTDVETYLNTLTPVGSTYHDVGMIWGARLLSPTGLFGSENVDTGTSATSRHLIFLTDGQTEPYDMAYGAYGLEPLDQRRWDETSAMSLQETVNERFLFACTEAKKRNITVWVIAFGTTVNPYMTNCAGAGRYFEAKNASDLTKAFSTIAQTLGDLRISS